MSRTEKYEQANYIVINTCLVRQKAEDRVYGLVRNLSRLKEEKLKQGEAFKIIVTGCMVGLALRDKTGRFFQKIRERLPGVDEFLPIEEVGFDHTPVRQDKTHAWVPISNGCNNFCTFCVVPFTRGREISRPYEEIITEVKDLKDKGYKRVTLLGQNVNSYGADLILGEKNVQVMRDLKKPYFAQNTSPPHRASFRLKGDRRLKPIYVKHLGRYRLPTLFPYLLEEVAQLGFAEVNFISSNPWDFSDELIDVIERNANITRTLHLPIQSGDDNVLRRMNRWYTAREYLALVERIRKKVPGVKITTDIIVGFCGESEKEFQNTVRLCQKVGFAKAYLAMYSPRPLTAATNAFRDDVPYAVKKRRWQTLENLINQPNLDKPWAKA